MVELTTTRLKIPKQLGKVNLTSLVDPGMERGTDLASKDLVLVDSPPLLGPKGLTWLSLFLGMLPR